MIFPLFQIADTVRLIPAAINFKNNTIHPEYQKDGLSIGDQFTVVDSMRGTTVAGKEQYLSIQDSKGEIYDCYPSWCFELVYSNNSGVYEKPITNTIYIGGKL